MRMHLEDAIPHRPLRRVGGDPPVAFEQLHLDSDDMGIVPLDLPQRQQAETASETFLHSLLPSPQPSSICLHVRRTEKLWQDYGA
jgi:hypothetical protein